MLLLGALYFQVENAPYYAHVVRSLFTNLAAGFYPFHFFVFLGILVCLLVPIGLSGALLPLVFHHLRNEMGGLGGIAGRLYAWNTFGSLLGALLGGYALLFFIDLHQVFAIALAALVVGASLLSVLVLRLPALAAAVVAAVGLGACWFLPNWEPFRMVSGLFRQRGALPQTFDGPRAFFESRGQGTKILFYDDDPTHTVAVTDGNSRSLVTNGKPDGNLRYDYTTMSLLGLIPALLSDEPARVFVIGWGLGVSAGVLGSLDDVKQVTAVEISPAVLEAAPLFDKGNQNATTNPKIRQIRSDAYRALLRSDGQFNVIVSEPSNPWVMGVEMLFSREFLSVARDRLAPGGVYAQWFHLYEVDDHTLNIVMRTFKAVFGDMAIWFTRGADVVLLGFKDTSPVFDMERLRQRFERADFRENFERAGVGSWPQLLAHEVLPLGAVGITEMAGPLHTVRNPILSDSAARAFFAGGVVSLPRMASEAASEAGARGSLLARELAGKPVSEDMLAELTQQSCAMSRPAECGVLLARWKASHPDSPRLAQALRDTRSADLIGALTIELPSSTIESLAELYRGNPLKDTESPGLVRNAIVTSAMFAGYFNYAFPFDRNALRRAWADCASDPLTAMACAQARRNVELTLGPIHPENAKRGSAAAPAAAASAGAEPGR